MSAFRHDYSAVDRFVHRMGFRSLLVTEALADIEDVLFAKKLRQIEVQRPVFVTSLPRCGTTTLLQLLCDTGSFAAHSYADMPFVLCPLLWHHITHRFRKTDLTRERAHGDGVLVNVDTPESFEEIVWRAFWPAMYSDKSIRVWTPEQSDGAFAEFFLNHIRKIILLRGGSTAAAAGVRYISKNNVNISRLGLIASLFPDGTIIVPFRNPRDQCLSLLRQHENFCALHEQDEFARQYMHYVGHREFGKVLTPIDFQGWLTICGNTGPRQLEFWVQYWCAAFGHVLRNRPANVVFIDYDRLCSEPQLSLLALAERLQLRDHQAVPGLVERIRLARSRSENDVAHLGDLGAAALHTHRELQSLALNRN
jgi:hypothetical protein